MKCKNMPIRTQHCLLMDAGVCDKIILITLKVVAISQKRGTAMTWRAVQISITLKIETLKI